MSSIVEQANAEADAVEAELGPDEELEADGEDEQEQEPEPETEALSQKQIEAMFKKLDSEADRHTKRVQELTGDSFADLLPCPRCHPSIPGFCGPPPPEGLPAEQIAAVDISMGRGGAAEYQMAPWAEMCATCAGLGSVLSGALTEHGRLIVCKACNGAGWVDKREPVQQQPQETLTLVQQPNQPVYPVSNDGPDRWDRPPGHPHYGIEPKYVVGN